MSTPPLPRSPFMRSAPSPQDMAELADILRRSGAVIPPDVEKLLRPFTGLLPAPSAGPSADAFLKTFATGEVVGREIVRFMGMFFTNTLARKGAITLVEIVLKGMKTIDLSLDRLGEPSTPETRRRKGVKKSPKKPAAKKGPAPKRRRSLQDKAGSFTTK